jgi:hypothetical protein
MECGKTLTKQKHTATNTQKTQKNVLYQHSRDNSGGFGQDIAFNGLFLHTISALEHVEADEGGAARQVFPFAFYLGSFG